MTGYIEALQADRFAIYLFHGVIKEQRHAVRNYTKKHLLEREFTSVIRNLRAAGIPVSMPQIASGAPLPENAFAVTFDDGFANNYSVAAPILADYKVPAMFYVTTGFIEDNSLSWIDQVEYAVEAVDTFNYTRAVSDLHGTYHSVGEKITFLQEVRRIIKAMPEIDPYEFADEVCQATGITELEPDPMLDQKMNWAQARELHQHDLFAIGGHGHTHRILSYLSPDDLETEIATSMAILRQQLGPSIEHYSYPEGGAHCYSPLVIDALKRHGIICSPSAEHGTNTPGDDLFHLKRIMVV